MASREDKEAMFLEYSELLNSLDSGATTKLTINNRRLNRLDFEKAFLIDETGDPLDKYRREYNKILLDKATGANAIVQDMRDNCSEIRDLAMIDLLASTGMRVGEMVLLNRKDIDFNERECIVFGKGDKERMVYFDARTKLHLQAYLDSRADENPALFVSLKAPHNRMTIGGIETRLREMGKRLGVPKVHPHKFRRTLATMAIDKGMSQLPRKLLMERIALKNVSLVISSAMLSLPDSLRIYRNTSSKYVRYNSSNSVTLPPPFIYKTSQRAKPYKKFKKFFWSATNKNGGSYSAVLSSLWLSDMDFARSSSSNIYLSKSDIKSLS